MNIAFCYESVLPARGGCETYIADLARRLVVDGHEVHLYACRWDETALPEQMVYHRLSRPRGPRFLRPWLFGAACHRALRGSRHDVSVGFDKVWGLDVLYPQGGLHAASADHNLRKHAGPTTRRIARLLKHLDLAHWSFSRLEQRQYLGSDQPLIVVNSLMVQRHFEHYYGVDPQAVRVIRSAIDSERFDEHDRPRRRVEAREHWGIGLDETVAVFVAMNYRLKGLEPLLHALTYLGQRPLRLLVAGNPRTSRYERLAHRLGVRERVCFVGPQRDVKNCFFAADFLVHPTFYDPCSLVVLEALACGLPVITTRYNGASELLSPPREGYVIGNPHNHVELADSLIQLLDPARRTSCGQAARKAAAGWTFEHHYRQLVRVFAEAAARKQAA
ncbi:MAG TPA: glycosyltransferase family 4 protein [Gemmataceae bacterium]|nr:glycosyltransferase family 4 protein [Gemmataceae bacterium]